MADVIAVELTDQMPEIPDSHEGPCPKCGSTEQDTGYGLAGGGCGSYGYCGGCGLFLWKRQDKAE